MTTEHQKNADMLQQQLFQQNIIHGTRKIIKHMNQVQKFQKAKAHIMDALNYRAPRHMSESLECPTIFKVCYGIQSNSVWDWLLFICSYTFMYSVILDNQSYAAKIGLQASILIIFWVDNLLVLYIKQWDNFKKKNKYSTFFFVKFIIILLMTVDLLVFIILPCYDSRPIRPFRVLRCFVPALFDPELRKTLISFMSAYKDILVYIIFFSTVIVGYALIGTKSLTFDSDYHETNPAYATQYSDFYKMNYSNLGSMIFMVYVTATFDSYPDNQVLVIQNYELNVIYYYVFIFANMFIFSSIPGSLIYNKFRQTRSKILLIDEIRQQHSLILAYVSLAEEADTLSIDKLIKFLLYIYRYKIRFIEHITEICLKLDDNNNRSIQVNEFMQISKILLENSAMLPPRFDDPQVWIDFRRFMNDKFHLKKIVHHWLFQFVVSTIIILSFIDAIFYMYNPSPLVDTFNTVFVWLFTFELLIRIIAIGPENFFMDRWNNVDTFLVVINIIFYFVSNSDNVKGVVNLSRIFRLASLFRLISHMNFLKGVTFQIWHKLMNIFSIILQILPIIIKFMPLFCFVFYIYSIVGMELFYNFYTTNGHTVYNNYYQFSNFKSFYGATYIMVQVMTEAGWSQVAYDHSWRAPQYFAYVMLYFCLMHITIVYMVATMIKGIFWEVYFTVDTIFQQLETEKQSEITKEAETNQKTKEINNINEMIYNEEFIEPNSVIKRKLVQYKLDQEIFIKLTRVYQQDKGFHTKRKIKKSLITHKIIDDWNINIDELELSEDAKSKYSKKGTRPNQKKRKLSINSLAEVDQQDIESELSELLDKLVINPKLKYSELVASPKLFIDFLKSKLKNPEQLIDQKKFSLHEHPLHNQSSICDHIYQMHAILGIQTSKRQQKAMIIKNLIEENILSEEQGEKLIRKKLQEKMFTIDTVGTLRTLFLSGTNEELIKKFEIQYFSDVYGYTFKHINKMTLEPLLKLEASLTYSLKNIMRYPQIDNYEFFEMITTIEDRISNQLLQKGSLFKFVYKLDYEGDIWFSIQYKRQSEIEIHFLKTGIWCYFKEMVEHRVLYARDMFNWKFPQNSDKKYCQQYIKRFYQSFEALAFSLLDENKFFESNPQTHIYDLYIQHVDVEKTQRFKPKKLQISKIMLVILSKEQQRQQMGLQRLSYSVTDIISTKHSHKKSIDFKFDESEQETFEKLKNIAAMETEKIVESEGLPFAYIVNLMKQISDIMTIYNKNFVYQIQKVLNDQYEKVKEEMNVNVSASASKNFTSLHRVDDQLNSRSNILQ